MDALARVTQVQHLGGRRLSITFDDGLVRELDFAGVLVGLLEALDDDDMFATASVDRVAGTVRWPNDIDLDPDVLHGNRSPAAGRPPVLVREYRLQQAG